MHRAQRSLSTLTVSLILGALFILTPSHDSYATCTTTIGTGGNIQSSLNGLSSGQTLCLNNGTYSVSSSITIPSGVTLTSTSQDRSLVTLSSTASVIVELTDGAIIKLVSLDGNDSSSWGVMVYQKTGSNKYIWGLAITDVIIGIGVNGSEDVHIWDTFITETGIDNSSADPSIWIYASSNVEVLYGQVVGRDNGPGGDGETAAYDSQYVDIVNMHANDTGASAIYFVNCDHGTAEGTVIQGSDEWGLDIMDDSEYFTADGNEVYWSYYGGSVFDEEDNGNGTYTGNYFEGNDTGPNGFCNGINIIGNTANVTMSGNTVDTGSVYCAY